MTASSSGHRRGKPRKGGWLSWRFWGQFLVAMIIVRLLAYLPGGMALFAGFLAVVFVTGIALVIAGKRRKDRPAHTAGQPGLSAAGTVTPPPAAEDDERYVQGVWAHPKVIP